MSRQVFGFGLLLLMMQLGISAHAQVKIRGVVRNASTREALSGVSIECQGIGKGTFSDGKGNFSLTVPSLPVNLEFSSIGFVNLIQKVSVADGLLEINLQEKKAALGSEVVVSASRVPEKILSSPVSIERVSALQLRNAPTANYYDVISTLKGVDVTTSSLTFKTPTTRGFGGSGNTRFNQLIDGMDNQAPGLNFSVGSIVGLTELDVDNMELLSGASSALYGSGGMNGTLLISGKDPFKTPGLSFQIKTGMMHTDESEYPTSAYHNWNFRWAEKISDKVAFKLTSEMIQAKDWIGLDYRDYNRSTGKLRAGTRETDPNYDGVNVYGDETFADLRLVLSGIAQQAPFLAPFIQSISANPIFVSRTGYTEKELIDPNTISLKFGGAFHYKISDKTEARLVGYWGTGNTVYTGASRYSIKDFKMGQYKLEIVNKNWLLRGYTTQENAGNSFNLAATTQNFNEAWKPSAGATGWYSQYGQAFLGAKLAGMSDMDAHNTARSKADSGRPALGSAEFKSLYDKVRAIPVPQGGALLDRSDVYVLEGNYNFSRFTKPFADVIGGFNFKQYSLNSQGTLFVDTALPIQVHEVGMFVQASKQVNEKLKLTASGRFDKHMNFKGRFTPRLTAVYEVKPNKNIRFSYQTAYRFPSNQQQYINLDLVSYKLLGGNNVFRNIYGFNENPLYFRDSLRAGVKAKWDMSPLRPESVSSIELGYRGVHLNDKLLLDIYGYFGEYNGFIARAIMVQSKTGGEINLADTVQGNIYSIPVNSTTKIKTFGFGIGADYRLPSNFSLSANLSSDNLGDVPDDLITNFNSPRFKFNATFANVGFGKDKKLGCNLTYRWQDKFYFEGDLANGYVEAVQTLDAQISYKLPVRKCMFKLGANNLLNQYYYNAVGNSRVGGLYYMSFGYNVY